MRVCFFGCLFVFSCRTRCAQNHNIDVCFVESYPCNERKKRRKEEKKERKMGCA